MRLHLDIWAATWQNQQNECAPSEDSDQPGHPPSLISVFAVRMKKSWVLSYPLSAQRRLWLVWADAQAALSLRWAHSHFVGFVMSRLISVPEVWQNQDLRRRQIFSVLASLQRQTLLQTGRSLWTQWPCPLSTQMRHSPTMFSKLPEQIYTGWRFPRRLGAS